MTICDVCYSRGRIHQAGNICVRGRHVCAYHERKWGEAIDRLWEIWQQGHYDLDKLSIACLLPDRNIYAATISEGASK